MVAVYETSFVFYSLLLRSESQLFKYAFYSYPTMVTVYLTSQGRSSLYLHCRFQRIWSQCRPRSQFWQQCLPVSQLFIFCTVRLCDLGRSVDPGLSSLYFALQAYATVVTVSTRVAVVYICTVGLCDLGHSVDPSLSSLYFALQAYATVVAVSTRVAVVYICTVAYATLVAVLTRVAVLYILHCRLMRPLVAAF